MQVLAYNSEYSEDIIALALLTESPGNKNTIVANIRMRSSELLITKQILYPMWYDISQTNHDKFTKSFIWNVQHYDTYTINILVS